MAGLKRYLQSGCKTSEKRHSGVPFEARRHAQVQHESGIAAPTLIHSAAFGPGESRPSVFSIEVAPDQLLRDFPQSSCSALVACLRGNLYFGWCAAQF